ncbi:MAG: hypothetical protein ABIB71_01180 [Candidatus Woesearchaeota archaeon]
MKYAKLTGLIVLFVLVSSFAIAEEEKTFDTDKAYTWLVEQRSGDGSYGTASETAWAVLALAEGGMYDQAGESELYFDEQFGAGCYQKGNCKVKDTSLSVLALEELGKTENFTDIDAWFQSVMQSYTGSGRYLLELSPEPTGTCKLYVEDLEFEKSIEVNEGRFPGCGNSYFLDIDSCVKPNLLSANPGISINVDCSSIEAQPIVTALYKSANTFYIIDTQEGNVVDISFSNGCFGRGTGDSCNQEASLYANWAFGSLASEIDILFYLRNSYDRNDALNNALLYLSSPSSSYLSELKRLQSTDGSWNKDVMATALGVLAMNKDPTSYATGIEKARKWLIKQQAADGSMNGKVAETAATLYAAFAAEAELPSVSVDVDTVCDYDGFCDEEETADCSDCEEESDCGDGFCDEYAGEDEDTCLEDCSEGEDCGDGYCDSDYEDVEECPDDCYCDDNVCDDVESAAEDGDDYYCEKDCVDVEECNSDGTCDDNEDSSCADCAQLSSDGQDTGDDGSSWGKFLLIIIILIILGGAGYYAYRSGLLSGKKPGQPKSPFSGSSYKPFSSRLQQPAAKGPGPLIKNPVSGKPAVGPGARGFESELDKSLSEAKKLLKSK